MPSNTEAEESASISKITVAQLKNKIRHSKDDDSFAVQASNALKSKKETTSSRSHNYIVTQDEPSLKYICADEIAGTFSVRIQQCKIQLRQLNDRIIKSKNKMEERELKLHLWNTGEQYGIDQYAPLLTQSVDNSWLENTSERVEAEEERDRLDFWTNFWKNNYTD